MATGQLRRMVGAGPHPGYVRRTLAALQYDGLVSRLVRPRGLDSVWYLTVAGAELVEAMEPAKFARRYVVRPEVAAYKCRHTLAVNDVGLAFLEAQRSHRADLFGFLDWEHEVAHAHPDRKGFVIADALLTYVAAGASTRGRDVTIRRFIEVDRGSETTWRVVEKLQDYVALHRCYDDWVHGNGHQSASRRATAPPRWARRYAAGLPYLIVVFDDDEGMARCRRRMTTIAAACCRDDALADSPRPIVFAVLEDLEARGPFAPVFFHHTDVELASPVDVMGRAEVDSFRPEEDRSRPANTRASRTAEGR